MVYSKSYPNRRTWAPKPTPPVTLRPLTFTPSAYQQSILDWLTNDQGNAIVVATAGSGKTSTLELIARAMPTNANAVFLAFGKAIATELSSRLPFPASTFHSLCGKAVYGAACTKLGTKLNWSQWVDSKKSDAILDRLYGPSCDSIRSCVVRLVGLAKNENYTPRVPDDDLSELVARHNIEWEDAEYTELDVCRIAREVLSAALDDIRTIDFDDMIWFVSQLNLKLATYDYVLVDEAQDTNPLQRDIIRRIMSPMSRAIFVGDPAQAIYGFRGASNDALEILASEFRCRSLPLTVSYRCPVAVVQMASRYGNIEAAPNAKQGTVTTPKTFKFADFQPNDLVLCRNTAPLVRVCYKLISARVPAKIKGRDIGNGLKSLVTRLAGKRGTLETLPDKIDAYRDREVSQALSKRQETKAQAIQDKCDSILALLESMSPEDTDQGIAGLLAVIDSLFSDTIDRGMVLLSTIHKSKGLESDRVVILDWKLCPSKMARQEWQLQQEVNLQFVAITRSKDTLLFVDSEVIGQE